MCIWGIHGDILFKTPVPFLHHLGLADSVVRAPGALRAAASTGFRGRWVNDSEPEAEFQEKVNKSKAMLKAVTPAETLAKV